MEPRVSVIMAVYNCERFVRESVDSILAQSLSELELIIVNDGSTDRTSEILASITDPRVRVLHNERNVGPAAARSKAIGLARSEYIAVQDADDVALPMRLEEQVSFLDKKRNIALVGSHAIAIDEQGNQQGLIANPPADDKDIKWDLLFHNPFVHSSVVFRRSILQLTRLYTDDPEICRGFVEDYELVSRVNRLAESANIPEPLEKYRINPQGASARTCAEQRRQVGEVSKRNICWLLGCQDVNLNAWRGLTNFSVTWAPLHAHEARAAFVLYDAIYHAFVRRYLMTDSDRKRRRRQHLHWAKRALIQARRNPYLDRQCRAVMLGAAARLLVDAWRPGSFSFADRNPEFEKAGACRLESVDTVKAEKAYFDEF